MNKPHKQKKNIVKTVGYRRYVLEEDDKYYIYNVYEDKFSAAWEEQAKTGFGVEWAFVKWLDTEWQYDEVEV